MFSEFIFFVLSVSLELVPSTREGNQIATDSLKGQRAKRRVFVAEADGNGRDRCRLPGANVC